MNKVMKPRAVLILRKAEEYEACIQVDLKGALNNEECPHHVRDLSHWGPCSAKGLFMINVCSENVVSELLFESALWVGFNNQQFDLLATIVERFRSWKSMMVKRGSGSARAVETGYPRENPLTCGIVRQDNGLFPLNIPHVCVNSKQSRKYLFYGVWYTEYDRHRNHLYYIVPGWERTKKKSRGGVSSTLDPRLTVGGVSLLRLVYRSATSGFPETTSERDDKRANNNHGHARIYVPLCFRRYLVIMERRRIERTGQTGDLRENPPTSAIVWHNSHMRPGSPWREASSLTTTPPRPLCSWTRGHQQSWWIGSVRFALAQLEAKIWRYLKSTVKPPLRVMKKGEKLICDILSEVNPKGDIAQETSSRAYGTARDAKGMPLLYASMCKLQSIHDLKKPRIDYGHVWIFLDYAAKLRSSVHPTLGLDVIQLHCCKTALVAFVAEKYLLHLRFMQTKHSASEAEEHTTCIQLDLEQGFQKSSFYREQSIMSEESRSRLKSGREVWQIFGIVTNCCDFYFPEISPRLTYDVSDTGPCIADTLRHCGQNSEKAIDRIFCRISFRRFP
ncbi:hypothetical protein PR048_028175 [Dryococelus australis]|uniref:Uncharacterized protein n=1 Tax=Dryococelus australis TaxID=614101 RepID=A0ABQ9GII9_9NEOP|nr:hypothetical protein PR048_028175 [Dryococelus australis]